MRILKFLAVALLTISIITGCNNKSETLQSNEKVRMQKPVKLGMSQDSLSFGLNQAIINSIKLKKSELAGEAVSSYQSIAEALYAIKNGDTKKNIAALEKTKGKLEVVLARDPKLGFVSINATTKIVDLVIDLETIKKAAKKRLLTIVFNHSATKYQT
jgi:hypothetical protein